MAVPLYSVSQRIVSRGGGPNSGQQRAADDAVIAGRQQGHDSGFIPARLAVSGDGNLHSALPVSAQRAIDAGRFLLGDFGGGGAAGMGEVRQGHGGH